MTQMLNLSDFLTQKGKRYKMMRKILLPVILIICLFNLPVIHGATKSKSKKNVDPEEVLQKGREAFLNYDFESASDFYDEYNTLKTKLKQPLDEEFEEYENTLRIASNAFDRVQKIVIVDSLSLPRNNFYDSYKLASSSGFIGVPSNLLNNPDFDTNEVGFLNEKGDFLISVNPDGDGDLRLWESTLLLDGTWETQETLNGKFEKSGDYAFPFMSADGQTLYFANNGDDSMGGFDIFVAQKDPISGEYLQPLNIGMPFNSPYDDLMLAIDEENGIGWWASDRNTDEGKFTIYIYLLEDVRRNYPSDMENLADYARITEFKQTWTDENYQPIQPFMPALTKTLHSTVTTDGDFIFPLGNGKIYYKYTDFRNRKASDMMKQYLTKKKDLVQKEKMLAEYRSQYKSSPSLASRILSEEEEVDELRSQVKALKNEVLRLEKSIR